MEKKVIKLFLQLLQDELAPEQEKAIRQRIDVIAKKAIEKADRIEYFRLRLEELDAVTDETEKNAELMILGDTFSKDAVSSSIVDMFRLQGVEMPSFEDLLLATIPAEEEETA